jgi:hypothetical protein
MNIGWVLLAEGVAIDARGAVAAVGLSQNILPAASLPIATKRAVVAHLVEEPGIMQSNSKFTISIQVTSPGNQVIVAQTASVAIGHIPWPSLPATTDLPLEMALSLAEYGTYRFDVQVQPPGGGDPATGSVEMFVVRPEDQAPVPESN